jgi:hypothetical protein
MLENIPPPPKVGEYQPKSFGEKCLKGEEVKEKGRKRKIR